MKIKYLSGKIWFILALIGILTLVANFIIPGFHVITESTTTVSVTTIPTTTTLKQTTLATTVPTTTTLMNTTPTTTIQVRKPISVIAYSCDRTTDIITLTISNKGNTRIEEDEIKIYINDEFIGTFGKAIEPGKLNENSFQGSQGTNIVKAVSPSNSVRIVIACY